MIIIRITQNMLSNAIVEYAEMKDVTLDVTELARAGQLNRLPSHISGSVISDDPSTFISQTLQKVDGNLTTKAMNVELPNLKQVGGSFQANAATKLVLYSANSLGSFSAFVCADVSLPKLVRVTGPFDAIYANTVHLPLLTNFTKMNAIMAVNLSTPKVPEAKLYNILAPNAREDGNPEAALMRPELRTRCAALPVAAC